MEGPLGASGKIWARDAVTQAQMVSGERKRDGGFRRDLEAGSSGPVVNCVEGGKESGESSKVLGVWLEPEWVGGNLNEMENQLWAELCFGFFNVSQPFFPIITLLRRRIKLDLSLIKKRH